MSDIFREITKAGTSIWLVDLSRNYLSGPLQGLIENFQVRGVTTNPAIFSTAISSSDLYQEDILRLNKNGADIDQILTALITDDVQRACDLFLPIYEESHGVDGRVSLEVDPAFARNTSQTIAHGLELYELIWRPNLLIKVPATLEGLDAITSLTAAGISVNVTLIFSIERYQQVLDAYMKGLESRLAIGKSISMIHSVASFFISRIDTAIDPLLSNLEVEEKLVKKLSGKSALANAVLAYQLFENSLKSSRWLALSAQGANLQRPLWASTGVKNPLYRSTQYVDQLIAPLTVNTMPEKTVYDLQNLDTVERSITDESYADAKAIFAQLSDSGISIELIAQQLEEEALVKFLDPWQKLKMNLAQVTGQGLDDER